VIRLLADENLPKASVVSLRTAGHDIRSIAEDMSGASDRAVLALARSENRYLLTFDRDFGDLIYRHGEAAPPGVIYFRLLPADPEELARIMKALVQRPEIRLEGRLTIVTRKQVRQRPLP
jgi:predicted nuclease of predicted toxin-antitoxin system